MRYALLHRALPPITDKVSDERVADLIGMLPQQGWKPMTVQVRASGGYLSVLVEGDEEAPDLQVPGLELVGATELQAPMHLPDPPIAEPDPTVVDPQPTPWRQVRVRGERALDVVYGRGVIQRLHSVTVKESRDEVVVTVRIGSFPNLPEGVMVTLQLVIEAARVMLEGPLGDRPIRDGASRP